jgi:hypothetical protein
MKKITGLDRAMREQIGGVCVYWSWLELMVERVIAKLEGKPGVVTYDGKPDFAGRLRKLRKLAETHATPVFGAEIHKAEIHKILDRIENLRPHRHRVVHGLWGIDETNAVVWNIQPGLNCPNHAEGRCEPKTYGRSRSRSCGSTSSLSRLAVPENLRSHRASRRPPVARDSREHVEAGSYGFSARIAARRRSPRMYARSAAVAANSGSNVSGTWYSFSFLATAGVIGSGSTTLPSIVGTIIQYPSSQSSEQ